MEDSTAAVRCAAMSGHASRSDATDSIDRRSVWPAVVPVLALATLPYVTLLATNVGQGVDLGQVLIWWAVTSGVGLVAVAIAARWGPHMARWVGTLTALALYLLFNYPLVTGVRERTGVEMSDLWWWAIASAIVLGVAIPVARKAAVQRFIAVVAPALLIAPLFQLVTAAPAEADPVPDIPAEGLAEFAQTPNVYWFMLDAFAGPVYLDEELGVDTGPFVGFLEGEGFRVPLESRTNYPFTHLAMSSTLELDYVYEGVDEPPTGTYAAFLQGDNRTVDTFRANGYGYVHAYSGLWSGSRCGGSEDVCIGAHGPLSDTQWALASATPLIDVIADDRANSTIAVANDPAHVISRVLASAPRSPYFAMVHLMNPHTPFLRDAACRVRDVPLNFKDWGEGPEYADAVRCLFQQLEVAVGRILAVDPDAVIAIQGDHGPRLGLGRQTRGEVLLDDEMFFSAFSALRLPGDCGDEVPEDMTFVNTFRIVFACLAGEEPELVEDRLFPIRRRY
jgi:hypothetical protein